MHGLCPQTYTSRNFGLVNMAGYITQQQFLATAGGQLKWRKDKSVGLHLKVDDDNENRTHFIHSSSNRLRRNIKDRETEIEKESCCIRYSSCFPPPSNDIYASHATEIITSTIE